MLNTTSRKLLNLLRVFVIGSLVLFAITGGAIVYWVTQNAFNARDLVNSQIKYNEAMTKQVGQPTTIIQKYESPNK
jgi:flagellar basal body-associated protein FliL